MPIVQDMRAKLKDSMKARDAVRTNFLRYWIAGLTLGTGVEMSWVYKVTSLQTGNFAHFTVPLTLHLPVGSYEVCHLAPLEFNWMSTGRALCNTYEVLASDVCVEDVGYCVCLGPGAAKSGATRLSAAALDQIGVADLGALASLGLVGGGPTRPAFSPSSAEALAAWYFGATDAEPDYFLSAQLAVATLNTRDTVDPTRLAKVPSEVSLAVDGEANRLATISEVLKAFFTAHLIFAAGRRASQFFN